MKIIRRDPFARMTLERHVIEPGKCAWCGQNARYFYIWVPDSIRSVNMTAVKKVFCNIRCWKVYSGG